jgi:electron transport complex protein RnfA
MKTVGIILLSTILVDNFVLSKFLGICPFLGVSKKLSSALGMSAAVIFVMVLATAATWPIYTYVLEENGLEYLNILTFILVIAVLVQIIEIFMKKFLPPLYSALGIYLPLITTNCAVLGVTLLNITEGYNFGESLLNALGGGVGFGLALVIFSGVRERIEASDIPKAFKGIPSVFIAASITSLSFAGFAGIVEGIFG